MKDKDTIWIISSRRISDNTSWSREYVSYPDKTSAITDFQNNFPGFECLSCEFVGKEKDFEHKHFTPIVDNYFAFTVFV